ncbi:HEAT repeat domain-containing protein [Planctomyces sp. SH-PL62]|uniref:HEAT repeat domain-containing protein n=1 Tax=Planctomyces sp. SH-PL62 TaxID=1636152 RepID=UPI00078B9A34|nr:HEAT repeat domain-containing protein [Planctomyces sp. SH-PL62]AMV37221.1 hypothetical protein VT85_07300 [Planctomyces sp. SH-PL62]
MTSPIPPDEQGARTPASDSPRELPDLPPVELPSASFVVQLFLIPAAVVVAVVAVWLLFGKLAGGGRDALDYVREIRSGSGSWRSAYELATLLGNDPALASDPRLLGELTEMLDAELAGAEDPELARYLTLALGTFQSLDARLADGRAVDPLATLSTALDARFGIPIRLAAAASLARHAARLDGRFDDARAVAALAGAAAAPDSPELRRLAVFGLGFCAGEAASDALKVRVESDADRFVRYNAAVALARRGDPAATAPLREMLATTELERPLETPDEPDSSRLVETIQLQALEAIIAAATIDPFHRLQPEVEALTRSGSAAVRIRAAEVLQKLQASPRL